MLKTIMPDAELEKNIPVMGVNLGLSAVGNVAVGDSVYVK